MPNDAPLRVVLNGLPLIPPRTGIGRFVYQVSEALGRVAPSIKQSFFYGIRLGSLMDYQADGSVLRRFVKLPGVRAAHMRSMAYRLKGLVFHALTARKEFQLYHETNYVPYPFSGPVLTTIYDLSFLLFPETHPSDRVHFLEKNLRLALSRSDRFITISEVIKKEMEVLLGVDPSRIDVVYPGCSEVFQKPPPPDLASRLGALDLSPGYLLCVGTIEPRKNLDTFLRAYRILRDRQVGTPPLVVVGKRGWHWERTFKLVDALGLGTSVRFTSFLPDSALALVYAGARLFLNPSLYEGFGIPPLEALAQGVPLILSGIGPHREIYHDCALFADPLEPESWVGAMEASLQAPEEAAGRVERGRLLSRSLSWEETARRFAEVYRRVGQPAAG